MNPDLFKTTDHYYVVPGALDHRGQEVSPLCRDSVQNAAQKMTDAGIRNIAVVGKFSTRNAAHENQVKAWVENDFDAVFCGHQISGNLNFPRRIATAWLNASVYSLHHQFYRAVSTALDKQGITFPIDILKADGGTMSLSASMDFPAQTIQSGPAASVMGAVASAPRDRDVVILDIGGTTTDMAVLIKGAPVLEPLGIELAGHKTLLRSLKAISIGIGGDSAVHIHEGEIRVGPDRLGPAMAFGGSHPTPTDALFVLGQATGGDKVRAEDGISQIAAALGVDVRVAAKRIIDTVCSAIISEADNMVADINGKPVYTIHEFLDSYHVSPEKILVLGGPAKELSPYLSEHWGMDAVPVPGWHVANAVGAALARTTCEVSLFADTQRGVMMAPAENFYENVERQFTLDNAMDTAKRLLIEKAASIGADGQNQEIDVLESLSFNMMRGYRSSGKNIRVRVQIKPGLMDGYESVISHLAKETKESL